VKRPILVSVSVLLVAVFLLWIISPSCNTKEPDPNGNDTIKPIPVDVPSFDADSAYVFVERQVAFGPRVPGKPAHAACADWLLSKLGAYAEGHVTIQQAPAKLFTGETIEMKNIIATFNADIKRRILLCAHWDSRMFADHDIEKRDEAILGANDGGSGVAVLLEIGRQLSMMPLKNIGVDIILFDAEDQGFPDKMPEFKPPANTNETWCLGSQHWAKHRHRADYNYLYGILLDMVGGAEATFPREGNSVYYAPHVVDRVWNEAAALGYSKYFIKAFSNEILDDHYYINALASIPTIDIIDLNPDNGKFHSSWHTHDDSMNVISKETLKAVGQTVLNVIYKEAAGAMDV
jgi:Zn-dependent M28 family amino/carboxypeptidase